ncbi:MULTISPECIES: VOC family protein [unclassified Agromyces]|uniref:VOC family protein n=1 Tax=unclassified Agromyces TaxID=2639701 RepID=UPI0030156BC6
MPVLLTPYLSFREEAREAMAFYHSIFGGELTLSTFGDYDAAEHPAEADKIMHGHLVSGNLNLMGADTPNEMPFEAGTNFAVSLSGGPEDESRLREYWERLTEDGEVTVDLEASPLGDAFGLVVDRFGVQWMVAIGRPSAPSTTVRAEEDAVADEAAGS